MKRITLTCKDSGKYFHNCEGCNYYDNCDYFDKPKRKKKESATSSLSADPESGKLVRL